MNDQKDHDILVGLSAQFRAFADDMRDKVNTFVDGHKDHETRIRLLEQSNADLKGQIDGASRTTKVVYAVLTLVIAVLGTLVTWLLSR